MRYSEAVKRYKFETKQRILSNILDAAEKEMSDATPTDNNRFHLETKETNKEKKETITMKSTNLNEIRSRKGAAVAAACAIIAVGSGIAIFANSGKIKTDDAASSIALSAETGSSKEDSNEAEVMTSESETEEPEQTDESSDTDAVTDEVSSSAPSTSSVKDSSSKDTSSKNTSSAADTSSKKPVTTSSSDKTSSSTGNTSSSSDKNKAAADPDVKASFDDLLASTDYIMLGQIVKAEPTTITNRDGSKQYCIAYEIYHQYNYVKNTKQLYFIDEWDTTIYQPVAEGTKPTLRDGDEAVFMAYDSGSYGMVKTASNGVFAPGKNNLKSVSSSTDSINNAMTDYIFNTVLHGRDRYNVEGWISSLYGNDSYDWTDDSYDNDYPFEAAFVTWDDAQNKFLIYENTNPTWDKICHMLNDDEEHSYYFETDYPVYTDDPINHDDPIFVSDCADMDIALTGMFLNTKTNAISFDFSIMPKAGSRIILNDGFIYDLKADSDKILNDMGKNFNADSIIVTPAWKFSLFPDNCISFTIMLYQSEPNGKLSIDLDRNYSVTLGGIYDKDGNALYGSDMKLDFKVDPRILENVGDDEVNIITAD